MESLRRTIAWEQSYISESRESYAQELELEVLLLKRLGKL